MKKVLVTGANGFIGKNLVKELTKTGYEVVALVRDKNKLTEELKSDRVQVIECDMSDYKNLINLLPKNEIDMIYHFAWAGVSGTNRANYDLQLKNVKYSCELLETASMMGIKRFLYAGSLSEFEYMKCRDKGYYDISKNNFYGMAKLTARYGLEILSSDLGIEFLPITISNTYGAGEESERFLITLIKKMMSKEHMKLTKGEQLYDYIYITDAVKAICLVGNKGKSFKNYYIGNVNQKKLKEFVLEAREIVDKSADLGFGEIEYKGIPMDFSEFDKTALLNEFNFTPEISFEEGVKLTLEYLNKK